MGEFASVDLLKYAVLPAVVGGFVLAWWGIRAGHYPDLTSRAKKDDGQPEPAVSWKFKLPCDLVSSICLGAFFGWNLLENGASNGWVMLVAMCVAAGWIQVFQACRSFSTEYVREILKAAATAALEQIQDPPRRRQRRDNPDG